MMLDIRKCGSDVFYIIDLLFYAVGEIDSQIFGEIDLFSFDADNYFLVGDEEGEIIYLFLLFCRGEIDDYFFLC